MSSVPIYEEEELHPGLLSKGSETFISSQLNTFLFKEEFNKELEELIFHLVQYKKELDDFINDGKTIENASFKRALYSSLENMLIQAYYITSDQTRRNFIKTLYKWHTDKSRMYSSMPRTDEPPQTAKDIPFEAQDKPVEGNHKHRSRLVSIEDLKHYLVKKANTKRIKASKGIQHEKTAAEKQKDALELTRGSMKSTFYTSLQGGSQFATSEKLKRLKLQEILKENKQLSSAVNIPIQENKASYSLLRPPFRYDLLTLEKDIQKQKNKELKSKRTVQEIRAMVDSFGSLRAQYKGAMNKKYEMKKLLDRSSLKKKLSESLILTSKHSLIEPNNKQKPFETRHRQRPKKKESSLRKEDVSNSKAKKAHSKTQKLLKEDISSLINRIESNNSQSKITTDKVKNRKGSAIIKDAIPEKAIDLKMRLNSIESKKYLINCYKKDMDELPNDYMGRELFIDQIFKTRNMNKSLIDLRPLDSRKDGYLNLNGDPLSMFDLSHMDDQCNNNDMNNLSKHNSLNSIDYAKNTFKHLNNDYLLLRKTMANKREGEFTSLNKSITCKPTASTSGLPKRQLNKSALYYANVNPLDENMYPTSYLPHSGSGLLVTPYVQ